jgi:hypothetical protein
MSDSTPDALAQNSTFVLVDLRSGRAHPLRFGANSVGRSSKRHVVLDNDAVSRRHAILTVSEAGACEIYDCQSRNGVYLDGGRIRGTSHLIFGTLLQIWDFYLYFTRTDTSNPPPFSFTDEVLGFVIWNPTSACWHFGIEFRADWFVPAVYSPSARLPPDRHSLTAEWDAVRACFQQVKARETSARALVAGQSGMIGNPFGLRLAPIMFTPVGATLIYEDGGGAYCVTVDREGTFVSGPVWVPEEFNHD